MAKESWQKRAAEVPPSASWEELATTIPRNSGKIWYGFRDLVLSATHGGEMCPGWLVERYPEHPIVLLVKDFAEKGSKRKLTKAEKAVAGTDDRYLLLLMKS